MATLQHSLLPGTLGKGDKEKAPCETRNIKLSKEKQREPGQKGAFRREQAADSATKPSPPAPVPQPGPGLPTSQCHRLGRCHHPRRGSTRLGPSPGRSHRSPLPAPPEGNVGLASPMARLGAGRCFSWVQAADGQAGGSGGQPDPALPGDARHLLDVCSPQHDAGGSGSCWEMGRGRHRS